jgi:hypothetical protein
MPSLIRLGGYSWISKKRPGVIQIPLLWLEMFDEVKSATDVWTSQTVTEINNHTVVLTVSLKLQWLIYTTGCYLLRSGRKLVLALPWPPKNSQLKNYQYCELRTQGNWILNIEEIIEGAPQTHVYHFTCNASAQKVFRAWRRGSTHLPRCTWSSRNTTCPDRLWTHNLKVMFVHIRNYSTDSD